MAGSSDRRMEVCRNHVAPDAQVNQCRAEVPPPPGTPPMFDFDHSVAQSVCLPERITDQVWRVHRNPHYPQQLVSRYLTAPHVATLYDHLNHAVSSFGPRPCLGTREWRGPPHAPGPYRWMTFEQMGIARTEVASGLLAYGVGAGAFVGLYSSNCAEWLLCEHAAFSQSMVTVPLYDTLGHDSVAYICNHGELAAVCCSIAVLPTLLSQLHRCPSVQLVVVYPHAGIPLDSAPLPAVPAGSSARIVTLDQVRAAGRMKPSAPTAPSPETIATVCYTSGTTGNPKGVVLTHGNLIANSAGMEATMFVQSDLPINEEDVHISYLPLAHIYERMMMINNLHSGCACGFSRGDPLLLLDDIQALQPTIFFSVPRLWNRIYDGIMGAVNSASFVQRALFKTAFNQKNAALRAGKPKPYVWEKLVFEKIQARLGGRVRFLASGSSPISSNIMEFLRTCFCPLIEGYGMTEAGCSITTTHPGDTVLAHVGAPIACFEVKLDDVPEMGYTHADTPFPRGEICVRGPSVFREYYKDEVNTRETIDADGWLHTGDIGTWVEQGRLKIIDRKKNIFKLQQGEYISPEKIENIYARCPLVAQSFVYGDSTESCLVAIVVPDPEVVAKWAAEHGKADASMEQLCADPALAAAVLQQMTKLGRADKLQGFEMVKAVHLHTELFSMENGLITPTFKLKRQQARDRFRKTIDALYASLKSSA